MDSAQIDIDQEQEEIRWQVEMALGAAVTAPRTKTIARLKAADPIRAMVTIAVRKARKFPIWMMCYAPAKNACV